MQQQRRAEGVDVAVEVLAWVWNHSRSRNGQRLVLLAVADCARADGSNAFPSVKELVRKTALSERAVRRAVSELADLGELVVQRAAGPSGCNRYRVVMTPANLALLPKVPPANLASPEEEESSQVNVQEGADLAPPANLAPLPKTTRSPANLAPGTVKDPSPSSPTEKKEGVRGRNTGEDPLFVEFYDAYPRKRDRGAARKAWAEVIRKGFEPNVIIEAARRYRNDPQVRRGYSKYPATWLRAESFLDEPEQLPMASTDPRNYPEEDYFSGF